MPPVPLMDRAAEGLVESVVKTYVSVLIPPWEVCARALASIAVHGCSPLPTALPSKQASPAQLCNYTDHLLPLGFSSITATAAVLTRASVGKE